MINFITEGVFMVESPDVYRSWILDAVENESFELGELTILFCDDAHLHKLNLEFLRHDTLTDILTFDYSVGKRIDGDICISIDRVRDNATHYGVNFLNELARVMIHGVLHLCGYNDKEEHEKEIIRNKESHYMSQLFIE